MIGQSQVSSCFRSVARYLERPKPERPDLCRVAWTAERNLVCTDTLQDIAWEMTVVARSSERVQKPVYHLSLSWAPEDDPDRAAMETVADEVLRDLSMAEHQAVYVAHADEAYRHLHVLTNRVHPSTRRVQSLFYSYYTIQTTLRHAEVRYGFRQVPGHLFQLPGQSPPERSVSLSKGAYKALCRDKALPFQLLVQRVAADDFAYASGWTDLTRRLDEHGLRMETRRSGLVVTDGDEYVKSSSIAPGISRRRLEERFGGPFRRDRAVPDRACTLAPVIENRLEPTVERGLGL